MNMNINSTSTKSKSKNSSKTKTSSTKTKTNSTKTNNSNNLSDNALSKRSCNTSNNSNSNHLSNFEYNDYEDQDTVKDFFEFMRHKYGPWTVIFTAHIRSSRLGGKHDFNIIVKRHGTKEQFDVILEYNKKDTNNMNTNENNKPSRTIYHRVRCLTHVQLRQYFLNEHKFMELHLLQKASNNDNLNAMRKIEKLNVRKTRNMEDIWASLLGQLESITTQGQLRIDHERMADETERSQAMAEGLRKIQQNIRNKRKESVEEVQRLAAQAFSISRSQGERNRHPGLRVRANPMKPFQLFKPK